MSEPEPATTPRLELRLPVAAVRLCAGAAQRPAAELLGAQAPEAGIVAVADDRFLVLPAAGDPAIYDTAVHWCRRLLAGEKRSGDKPSLSLLVAPGKAVLDGERPLLAPDPLAGDLDQQPPALEPGRIYLTAWAGKMLERSHQLEPGPTYRGPSGASVPLMVAGGPIPSPQPWRNPEILNRRLRLVERPGESERMQVALAGEGLLLEGPLGCGKSRLLKAALDQRSAVRLWLHAQPARRGAPNLVGQIARQLLAPTREQLEDPLAPKLPGADRQPLRDELRAVRAEGPAQLADWVLRAARRAGAASGQPLHLVIDDAEQLVAGDVGLLAELRRATAAEGAVKLVLCSRPREWPAALEELPRLALPPFDDEEMTAFADRLCTGLSLPEAVQERILAATSGFPFALEEGMIELIRDKDVRRIYGSFFFGGQESAEYRPSLRLVCHLEAEAARVGAATTLRLAALAGMPVPTEELAAAAEIFSLRPPRGWAERAAAAGLARSGETPFGAALEPACAAFGAALARGVEPSAVEPARRTVGELLAARAGSGKASWESWELLQGSPEGAAALLAAVQSGFGKALPREQVLAALGLELKRHQERSGETDIGLKLLWQLLPVARRLGRLQDYEQELARAVELAADDPRRLLALASVKAELEQEAGRYQEAESTIQAALKAAKGIDLRRQALLLIQLGKLFIRQARYSDARQLFENLRGTLEQQSLPPLAASCRFYLGNIAMHENRLEEAAEHHRAALEQRQAQNLLGAAGLSLSALGAVALAQGNYPDALTAYQQAHDLLTEHGKPTDIGYTLLGVGRALTLLGDYTAASKPLRQALELRAGRDDVAGESIARLEVARNYLHLGQPETALREARKAHFHLELLSVGGATADAETLLGRIRLAQRRHDEARTHLAAALAAHRRLEMEHAAAFDLAWLLDTALALEDADAVRRYAVDLKALLDRLQRPDMGERLHLRMFRGLEFMSSHGHTVVDPRSHLEAAYREVLRKAAHLEPQVRHRFLLQIDDNQAIVDAAARLGLTAEPEPA